METKKYFVKGSYIKKGFVKIFTKEIYATSEKRALDKVYSLIGSNHKVKRREINIHEVKELNE